MGQARACTISPVTILRQYKPITATVCWPSRIARVGPHVKLHVTLHQHIRISHGTSDPRNTVQPVPGGLKPPSGFICWQDATRFPADERGCSSCCRQKLSRDHEGYSHRRRRHAAHERLYAFQGRVSTKQSEALYTKLP